MVGWSFPRVFVGNGVSTMLGKDNVIKDLSILFNSEIQEFTRDPGYGSNVPLLRFRPKNRLTLDLLVDAICQAEMFLPNVAFDRTSVETAFTKAGKIDISTQVKIDLATYPIKLQLEI